MSVELNFGSDLRQYSCTCRPYVIRCAVQCPTHFLRESDLTIWTFKVNVGESQIGANIQPASARLHAQWRGHSSVSGTIPDEELL